MADLTSPYHKIDIKAFVLISSKRYACTAFSTEYMMDRIPTARVELPIGRSVYNESLGAASITEQIVANLMPFTPIQVWLKTTVTDGKPVKGLVDGQYILLFDGYMLAPWHRKVRGGEAAMSVDVMGQPGSLAGGSQFGIGTVVNGVGNDTEITVRLGNDQDAKDILSAALGDTLGIPTSDIGGAIINFMLTVVRATPVDKAGNEVATLAAQSFLQSLMDNKVTMSITRLPSLLIEPTNRMIKKQIVSTFYDYWRAADESGNGDLWDGLTKLFEIFKFHLCPCINYNILAPVFRGLGGAASKEILPAEYWEIETRKGFNPKDYSYVTSVYLYSYAYQPKMRDNAATTVKSLGSAQTASGVGSTSVIGRTRLMHAPSWIIPADPLASTSVQPDKGIPDASNVDGDAPKDPPPFTPWADTSAIAAGLGNRVAQTMLFELLYAHRVVRMTGRLRLDICPGSLIKFQTAGETFSGVVGTFYGIVAGVGLNVGSHSGQRAEASTTFTLVNVHSEAEHNGMGLPIAHPIYDSRFEGAPLYKGVT